MDHCDSAPSVNTRPRAHHLEVAAARAAAGKRPAPRYFTSTGLGTLLGLRGLAGPPAVRLLSARFLVSAATKGSVLPRRQDLEVTAPEAYCSYDVVRQCLDEAVVVADRQPKDARFPGLVVVSYCWHGHHHPDPDGALIRQLAPILTWYAAERAKRFHRTVARCEMDAERWEARGNKLKADDLRKTSQAFAAKDPDFAVFIDYWSLFQGLEPGAPPDREGPRRTAVEQEAFEMALAQMDLFYAHSGTTVVRLSQQPPEWGPRGGGRTYSDRGWCTFELYASMLVKNWSGTLDVRDWQHLCPPEVRLAPDEPTASSNKALAAKAGTYDPAAHRDGGGERGDWRGPCGTLDALLGRGSRVAPIHPDAFDRLIASKDFTVPGDHDRVGQLYRQVAVAVLASAGEWLSFEDKLWDPSQFAEVARTVVLCNNLEGFLGLGNTGMDDAGAEAFCAALTPTTLPKLELLSISNNPLGAGAARAFAGALHAGMLPQLKKLYFKYRTLTMPKEAIAELEQACFERNVEPL